MKHINASAEIVLVHNHPAINTDILHLINPEISISPPMEEQVFRSRSFSHNALDIASKIFFSSLVILPSSNLPCPYAVLRMQATWPHSLHQECQRHLELLAFAPLTTLTPLYSTV